MRSPLMWCTCLTLVMGHASGDSGALTDFTAKDAPFVLQWTGQKPGSNRVARCTATLIAPQWAITARHCAVKLLNNVPDDVQVTLSFYNAQEKIVFKVGVADAFGAPLQKKGQSLDVALVKLKRSVQNVPPALLDAVSYKNSGMSTRVIQLAQAVGSIGRGPKLLKAVLAEPSLRSTTLGARGGDSGGAWLRTEPDGTFVLSGVISGGVKKGKKRIGIAYQPSYVREWIDNKTGGTANWTQPAVQTLQEFMDGGREVAPMSTSWATEAASVGCTFGVLASAALLVIFNLRRSSTRSSTGNTLHSVDDPETFQDEATGTGYE
eukprot:CAMPEP_0179190886 /NCGR_PEP_ID=MMETSP0796-20121207/94798_1 /TAXON_ID=73915 /ORGANISM="Pyrodinium bahamense, Strain pbaha01" /LENGTH=320 /DNA_ID=CAMNT_0020895085 /DNA_START=46 /DNA_END=1009 /DNA_ORIENTATION=+